MVRALPPAVLPLLAASLAFLAAQGFGRFGFGLVLPAMRDGLGLSTGQMGLLAGIGLTAYLLSSAPAGALAARIGTRPVVVGGLLGIALGLVLTGLANSFAVAMLAQLLAGASAPLAIVPLLAISSRWVPVEFRGRVTGVVVGAGGVGIVLAGLLVPALLAPADAEAWRRAWWGLAAGVLAAAGVAAAFLRDPPSTSQPGAARPAPGAEPVDLRTVSQRVYRSGGVWRLALVFGLYGVSYIVYGTFFVAQAERHQIDAVTAGQLWSLAGMISIVSGVLGGALADRLGPRLTLVILFGLQGSGMALLALGPSVPWLTCSAVVYGLSLWGFPAAITKACTALVGPRLAAPALGLLATAFAAGQAGGPLLVGLLTEVSGSLTPGLLLAVLADAAGLAAAYWGVAPNVSQLRANRPEKQTSTEFL